MSRIGLHHLLSVSKNVMENTRALYQRVLGATLANVPTPIGALDIFTFDNGSAIGINYVEPDEALTPEQHMKAIWLEFEVGCENATAAALEKMGILPFEHPDKEHKYFQAPGGQCFRLAKRAACEVSPGT